MMDSMNTKHPGKAQIIFNVVLAALSVLCSAAYPIIRQFRPDMYVLMFAMPIAAIALLSFLSGCISSRFRIYIYAVCAVLTATQIYFLIDMYSPLLISYGR